MIEQELSCKSSGFVADMTPERRVTGKLENTICHPIAGTRSTVLVAQEAMETKRVDQLGLLKDKRQQGQMASSVRFFGVHSNIDAAPEGNLGLKKSFITRMRIGGNGKTKCSNYVPGGCTVRTKQEQEAVNINTYEAELRDCADFYHWQLDMGARDQKTRYEQIARTRDLARTGAKEAQQARLDKLVHNRQTALLIAGSDAMQTQHASRKT